MLDPLAPAIVGDATDRTVSAAASALPWPLSVVAGALLGDRLAAMKAAVRPNPYTTSPSGSQATIAAYQAHRSALRGGFSGLAGSTEEWDHDQGPVSLRQLTGLAQDVTTAAIPPSRMLPYTEQGHARDPNTTRGYTGPVITPGGDGSPRWGWSTRFAFPRIIKGTLLPPESRTPTPREMASGFVDAHPTGLRLDDPYLAPDALEDW